MAFCAMVTNGNLLIIAASPTSWSLYESMRFTGFRFSDELKFSLPGTSNLMNLIRLFAPSSWPRWSEGGNARFSFGWQEPAVGADCSMHSQKALRLVDCNVM